MAGPRRPQPLGVLPLPAGYLLIDDDGSDPAVTHVRETLVAGRTVSDWPDRLRGVELAHAGRAGDAFAAFDTESAVGRYNRFVLRPDGVDLGALRRDLPAGLAPMVDLVAYAVGLLDSPPEVGSATREVAALIMSAQASHAMESGRPDLALVLLDRAVDEAGCAPLTAVLLGSAGAIAADADHDPDAAVARLSEALRLLGDTDLVLARAELHYQLGQVLHGLAAAGRRPLTEAVGHYYDVVQLVDREDAPELWAAAQLSLGTAYLTMPMIEASDQLRSGIAMQSLRAAMEVFTQEQHPHEWASAQINLANALVYAPSTRQGDNLVEAVERYEQVLRVRDPDTDPLGYARLLANQGNALAHLGIFDHAKAKLYEARALFEQHGQVDAVMAVRQVLDAIAHEAAPQELADDIDATVAERIAKARQAALR